MANGKYNPFQFSQALTQLQGQVGGAGARWEGLQKGTSRETIRKWVEGQARKASAAATGLGRASAFGKLAGTLAMFIPGVREASLLTQLLVGGGVAGGATKILGDQAVRGLSYEDAPETLYGVDTAREAESTAHSAVDKLMSSVNPAAVTQAVTTPLTVLGLRNYGAGANPYVNALPGESGFEEVIKKDMKSRFAPRTGFDTYAIGDFLFGEPTNLASPRNLKDYLRFLKR